MVHLDRIIFGGTSCFLLKIPNFCYDKTSINEQDIDWEYVQKEFLKKTDFQKKKLHDSLEYQKDLYCKL
jgi:hypothetical protein